jgi:hypothetical protein
MPDEKKRFPWRLAACAFLLVALAAVLGFIETVGRQGTIVGRYERIRVGMLRTETDSILGPADYEAARSCRRMASSWDMSLTGDKQS